MATKTVTIKAIKRERLLVTIKGTSPLIQHQWSEKAKQMMRDKKMGKKTKNREVSDPQAEAEAATYRTAKGEYGIPAGALAKSFVGAAHKDLGIEKTLVRKNLFILCNDPEGVLRMV